MYRGILQSSIWKARHQGIDGELEKEMQMACDIELHQSSPQIRENQKAATVQRNFDGTVSKIVALMEQEKLFQETELTLQDLADKLQFPSYQVSQAINDGMKKSFYELVNGYRVEEAKRLLLLPQNRNYTILSVGFEAGFNSKTTFNTVFKKFTGLTPTEFRDRQKQQSPES